MKTRSRTYALREVPRISRKKNRTWGREKFLPDEIIIEILSKLPVKSLGRCKCVCKLWCTFIEDPKFIKEHLRRSNCIFEYGVKNTNVNGDEQVFKFVRARDGVLVEKSDLTGKFRLRNPTTKQILDLPDPYGTGTHIWLLYLPKTNNIKLVDVYCKERTENGGCQVLTVGTDLTWRAIDCPSLYDLGGERESFCSIAVDEVFYVTRIFDHGFGVSEVVCLEIESEHFSHVKIPHMFFSSLKHIKTFSWEKKFSIANLEGQELRLWVLEDIKKQKWAERKVVLPLSLFGRYTKTLNTLWPCSFSKDWFWFLRCDDSHVAYNIQTKQEYISSPPPGKNFLYKFIPSLVSLEGNCRLKQEIVDLSGSGSKMNRSGKFTKKIFKEVQLEEKLER